MYGYIGSVFTYFTGLYRFISKEACSMTIFSTSLKRSLRKPLVILAIFIMPIICLLIDIPFSSTAEDTTINSIRVAVADMDHSPASEALITKLKDAYNIQETDRSKVNNQLTSQSSDWALVIPNGFQNQLLAGKDQLIESYGFAEAQQWIPISKHVENILQSMKILALDQEADGLKESLNAWSTQTASIPIHTIDADKAASTGTGLLLYGMIILYAAFLFTSRLTEDREAGMSARIASTAISSWRYLLEHLASFSLILIIQNMLFVIAYQIFYPEGLVDPVLITLVLMIFSILSVGLMLLISELCRSSFTLMIASTIVIMLSSILGGLFVPIDLLPSTLEKIAMITPTYWFTQTLDAFYTQERYGFPLTMMFMFTVIFYLFSGWKRSKAAE